MMTEKLNVAEIIVPEDRAREFDRTWAEGLAAIILEQGLLNPITVRKSDDSAYVLVAGLHRLKAFEVLGWKEIEARISSSANDDEARLEEVMENLARHELTAFDRCHHLYELKIVYEKLHPEVKNGGDRGNQHTGGRTNLVRSGKNEADADAEIAVASEFYSFAESTAEKLGLSRRSIEIAVAIWKGLSVASRHRIRGTWLASHRASLMALSKMTPAKQEKVLECILEEGAASVADALTIIEHDRLPSFQEKQIAAAKKSLAKLDDDALDAVFAGQEQRILAWAKRKALI